MIKFSLSVSLSPRLLILVAQAALAAALLAGGDEIAPLAQGAGAGTLALGLFCGYLAASDKRTPRA